MRALLPEELFAAMKEVVTPEEMEEAVLRMTSRLEKENIRVVTEKLEEAFADNEEWLCNSSGCCISVPEEDCS